MSSPAASADGGSSSRSRNEIRIVKGGLLTTIQDLGRWGNQSRGVAVAGPMDPRSHRLANACVGNHPGAALLEITLTGPELEFQDSRLVALAGAEFEVFLDDRAMPNGVSFAVAPGSRLRVGRRIRGTRAYLAVAGGIDVEPQLGSRATHLVSRIGGLNGRALQAGDRLPLLTKASAEKPGTPSKREAVVAGSERLGGMVIPHGHARVRIVPGPQSERFVEEAITALQSSPYSVATNSDRMGFRLQGPLLVRKPGADMISDATPLGALQVPASGQPVLLMADRQTTGGYPIIATVITADIGLAGQLGPGDSIAFEICSRGEALSALIAQERALMAAESAAAP
jgi:antagonist of KipI